LAICNYIVLELKELKEKLSIKDQHKVINEKLKKVDFMHFDEFMNIIKNDP